MREDPLPDADPNEKFYGVSDLGYCGYYYVKIPVLTVKCYMILIC